MRLKEIVYAWELVKLTRGTRITKRYGLNGWTDRIIRITDYVIATSSSVCV